MASYYYTCLLDVQMPVDQIRYSERYSDDEYEYRYVDLAVLCK